MTLRPANKRKKSDSAYTCIEDDSGSKLMKRTRVQMPVLCTTEAGFSALVNNLMPEIFNLMNGSRLEAEMSNYVLNSVMDIPMDWVAFPVQADPFLGKIGNRGFYRSEFISLRQPKFSFLYAININKYWRSHVCIIQLGVATNQTQYLYDEWKTCEFKALEHKKLVLPEQTMVYGEFVDQARVINDPQTVFHIIDAAIVGGVDVTGMSFADR